MSDTPILIVEDDRRLAEGVATVLQAEGYPTVIIGRGDEALPTIDRQRPRLVVLDVMLPGRDGFAVLRGLRAQGHTLPVLLLTAKSQEDDKVRGFGLGADDYLTKPFGLRELVARVQALLRRSAPSPSSAQVQLGDVTIDCDQQRIVGPAGTQALSSHEALILRSLADAGGVAVSRRRLLREVWGESAVTDRAIDYHIVRLRRKIAAVTGRAEPAHLLSAHGLGYRLI